MADLYNLLDELDHAQEAEQEEQNDILSSADGANDDEQALAQQDEVDYGNDNDNDDDDNNNSERLDNVPLPPALAEAAAARRKRRSTAVSASPDGQQQQGASPSSQYLENDEETTQPLSLGDVVNEKQNAQELLYTHLRHWWTQEILSPTLLPYQTDVVDPLLKAVEQYQDDLDANDGAPSATTGNPHMDAVLQSVRQMDVQRVQFIAAHLLQTRLNKLEQDYALTAVGQQAARRDGNLDDDDDDDDEENENDPQREALQRMSAQERTYLADYHNLLEGHLQSCVTNHFPQEAWKSLYEPEMLPDPNASDQDHVLVRIVHPCGGDDDDDNAFTQDDDEYDVSSKKYQPGTCLLVRYGKVRAWLDRGDAELLM